MNSTDSTSLMGPNIGASRLMARGLLVVGLAMALHAQVAAATPSPGAETKQGRGVLTGEATGVVTRVSDGDTVWMALPAGTRPVKVRIEGIDAPETCQPWGPESRVALAERLRGRAITAKLRGHDSYGRRLAKIFDDTEDIGEHMVRQGHAWSMRYRSDRGPYVDAERSARSAGLGLHAQRDAERPRDFRKRHGPCDVPQKAPR